MKKYQRFLLGAMSFCAVAATMMPSIVSAHGAWFAQRCDRLQLVVGEGWKDNGYDPKGLVEMKAFDADYAASAIKPLAGENYIYIEPNKENSVVYTNLDYGFWSNTPDGKWVPRPMDEVAGSTIGTHAVKYAVSYLNSVKKVKPLENVPYQLVPSVDPTKLQVGDEFTVQLLHNGAPMANVDIIPDVINHHTVMIKTDANGRAKVKVDNGSVNVIGCEMVVPYENKGIDKKATRSKVFVSLSYTIYPPEDD